MTLRAVCDGAPRKVRGALGRVGRGRFREGIWLCGVALVVGCTHRVELKRSPFITPLPEGQRQAIAAPEGSPAPSPAAPLPIDGPAMDALRGMQEDAEGPLVRATEQGDSEAPAVAAARARLAAEPRSLDAQLALARAYHHERIFDMALEHYLAGRELAPHDPAIARDLGRLWVDAGSPELALPYLDEALGADPSDAEAWSYRGIALDMLGRYPDGETALRRAIAANPLRWDYFNNLGYNLLLQERHSDAADAFASGLVLAPAHAVLQNNLGLALGLAGRPAEALEAFRKGGSEAEAWNNLGVVHRARGDLERAAEAFERAYELDPISRAIARNVRETRMRRAFGSPAPDTSVPAAVPTAAESPDVIVVTPVKVGERRDDEAEGMLPDATDFGTFEVAGARPAPRVVPILPVDLTAAAPVRTTRASGGASERPPAGKPAERRYGLELTRTPFPDLAQKAAVDFRRRTGRESRVNRSGGTYMVQIGRSLTLEEARALRAVALQAGYAEARVRDGRGRTVTAGGAAGARVAVAPTPLPQPLNPPTGRP